MQWHCTGWKSKGPFHVYSDPREQAPPESVTCPEQAVRRPHRGQGRKSRDDRTEAHGTFQMIIQSGCWLALTLRVLLIWVAVNTRQQQPLSPGVTSSAQGANGGERSPVGRLPGSFNEMLSPSCPRTGHVAAATSHEVASLPGADSVTAPSSLAVLGARQCGLWRRLSLSLGDGFCGAESPPPSSPGHLTPPPPPASWPIPVRSRKLSKGLSLGGSADGPGTRSQGLGCPWKQFLWDVDGRHSGWRECERGRQLTHRWTCVPSPAHSECAASGLGVSSPSRFARV